MRRLFAMFPTLLLLSGAASADSDDDATVIPVQASVLVTTTPAVRGSLPKIITAYGQLVPAPDGSGNLSLLRAGQVTQVRVSVGQFVREGDVLLEFNADPASIAAYQQAASAVTLAEEERARTAELLTQQLATRSQLHQAEKALVDARVTLDALKRSGGGAGGDTVTAPYDAVVTGISVASGDRVQPTAPLLQLARPDRLQVVVGIEPGERSRVASGQPVQLDPLVGEGGVIDGKIASVASLIDPKTRLVTVAIDPIDRGRASMLGAGYRARIRIGTATGWVVPRESVITDDNGAHVFQAIGTVAKSIPVKVLGSLDDTAVVDGALTDNAIVVVTGSYQLTDGATIRLQVTPVAVPGQTRP